MVQVPAVYSMPIKIHVCSYSTLMRGNLIQPVSNTANVQQCLFWSVQMGLEAGRVKVAIQI